ncbi:TPA: DNA polymerase I [Klebsiella variicola subsp. variicola]|nr:DNA polymerase I [Klebsiella variicola subsp. variicola]
MPYLYCDLETYSPTPIKHGSHKYAEQAEVMLFAYALGDEPVKVWDCTQDPNMPPDLHSHLHDEGITTVWHNGGNFDRVVLSRAMGITLPIERVHDTMIQAYAHSLPGSLGMLCEVFGIKGDEAKDKEGKRLIQLFCKPRPKSSKLRRATKATHPADWAHFCRYAGGDIAAMRAIHRKLPRWNNIEQEIRLWRLDQAINWRGVRMDLDLANGAIVAVENEKLRLAEQTQILTAGEVESATKRDQLLKFICESFGVTLPDMQASTLERRINDPDTPAGLRELLAIRLSATTSSTAKYKTLINSCSSDGRLRGLLQFCGAARTGRWAGRIFQPQNLPRPTLKQKAIDYAIEAFKGGYADLVLTDLMQAASSALRGCIIAPNGKKLCISDLSNIEGRVLTWLAGEEWKLAAFRDADAGRGRDLYVLAYAKAFNIDPDQVDKDLRQIGKCLELSMGYGGGVGAFAAMALGYNLELEKLANDARPSIPAEILEKSAQLREFLTKKKQISALPESVWLVFDALKQLWRNAHPKIVGLWKAVEEAAKKAILGIATVTHGMLFERKGGWLRIRLPSGRWLSYPSPRVEDGQISYMGTCPYSRKWRRLKTFGGKLVENIVQAIARDVLADNMPEVERQGYEIILSVHDELLTETPDSPDYSAGALSRLLAIVPRWAQGMPLAAAGFEAYRYRKD